MKHYLTIFLSAALILFSCNSASAKRVEIKLDGKSSFTAINLTGPHEVTYTASTDGSTKVSYTVEEAVKDRAEVFVKNGTLTVRTKKNTKQKVHIVVTVSSPGFETATVTGSGKLIIASDVDNRKINFSVTGSGSIMADKIKSKSVKSTVTGSGSIKIKQLDSTDFTASITGSGSISATGRAGTGSLSVTGSGTIDAEGLAISDAKVSKTGSGKIKYLQTGDRVVGF